MAGVAPDPLARLCLRPSQPSRPSETLSLVLYVNLVCASRWLAWLGNHTRHSQDSPQVSHGLRLHI